MTMKFSAKDFQKENFTQTLIALLQAHDKGVAIITAKVIPPEFLAFAETKGCGLTSTMEIVGEDSIHSGWKVTVQKITDYDISIGDTVKDKNHRLNNNLNMPVLDESELLAEVDLFDNELTNRQIWVLKADLDLIHKADRSFKNAGEG